MFNAIWIVVKIRRCKEIWIFAPFSKDTQRKLKKICFALYQLNIELKTKSLLTMPSNVLPLHSSQNSNADNILLDLDTKLSIVSKIYRTLKLTMTWNLLKTFSNRPSVRKESSCSTVQRKAAGRGRINIDWVDCKKGEQRRGAVAAVLEAFRCRYR